MTHLNYHEVGGANPVACGRELGRLFGPTVREYIEEERDSKIWRQRRRDAQALLTHTTQFFPAYVEELQGYADAAGVELLDLWTMSVEDELDGEDHEKCTTVVTSGGKMIAHNEDWDSESADDICILKRQCGKTTTLELYYYGTPLGRTALSICSSGYVQAINSLDHSDWQAGVPKIVLARALSELSGMGGEVDRLLAIPRSSGFAHTLVHRSGQVASIECTATRHVMTSPTAPFVHTNHTLHPSLEKFAGEPDGKSTFKRYDTACRLVRAEMNEADLVRLTGDATCGKTESILNKNTIARAVADLDRRVVKVWLKRESQKGWVDYPIDFLFDTGALSA